jgi:hypothetical protein
VNFSKVIASEAKQSLSVSKRLLRRMLLAMTVYRNKFLTTTIIEQDEYISLRFWCRNSCFGINCPAAEDVGQKTPKCRAADTFLSNDHL